MIALQKNTLINKGVFQKAFIYKIHLHRSSTQEVNK